MNMIIENGTDLNILNERFYDFDVAYSINGISYVNRDCFQNFGEVLAVAQELIEAGATKQVSIEAKNIDTDQVTFLGFMKLWGHDNSLKFHPAQEFLKVNA